MHTPDPGLQPMAEEAVLPMATAHQLTIPAPTPITDLKHGEQAAEVTRKTITVIIHHQRLMMRRPLALARPLLEISTHKTHQHLDCTGTPPVRLVVVVEHMQRPEPCLRLQPLSRRLPLETRTMILGITELVWDILILYFLCQFVV